MRVIAGTAKGHPLTAPRGERTRPTADRVKEALFSSLQPRLLDASVVDLFAGSGALGIEALSRGAAHVLFVEKAPAALDHLRRNLGTTGVEDRATVVRDDVMRTLADTPVGAPFDIALLDPPYDLTSAALEAVLAAVATHLADGGLVVVERASRSGAIPWPDPLKPGRSRRYGDTVLHDATLEQG